MAKILFLDFDGTTYSHTTESMPKSAIEAIRLARENGILVFLCTGRSKIELSWFDLGGAVFDGYVLNNGQVAFDKDFNLIYSNAIAGQLKDFLVNLFNKKRLPVMFCDNENVYINTIDEHITKVQSDIGSALPEIKEYDGSDFVMAAVYFTKDEDKDMLMSYKNMAEITYWHQGAVDIVPKGASKSTGIDNVLAHYNLKIEDAIGFGDGENDIKMLKHCSIGVAMGNSTEEVKQIADYITDDIDNDGLYKAFKYLKLI